MSTATKLTAIERIINAVDSMPNLIKVVTPGAIDEVIRIVPLQRQVLDTGKGPHKELWEGIKRRLFLEAPYEQKTVAPVPVGNRREWTILPDDVPVVDLRTTEQKEKHVMELGEEFNREGRGRKYVLYESGEKVYEEEERPPSRVENGSETIVAEPGTVPKRGVNDTTETVGVTKNSPSVNKKQGPYSRPRGK